MMIIIIIITVSIKLGFMEWLFLKFDYDITNKVMQNPIQKCKQSSADKKLVKLIISLLLTNT